jgi:hypothetical protein
MKEISRKKFLRTVGSIVGGGAVAGVAGALIAKKAIAPGFPAPGAANARTEGNSVFASPYRRVSSFAVSDDIRAFEQHAGRLYVAVPNAVRVFDRYGKLLKSFPAGEVIRDMAAADDGIYLLYPSAIEVYTHEGRLLRQWEACSEQSNYCSLALAPGRVFASDMGHRNICLYTSGGSFVRFITGPEPFVIPSLSFGIAFAGGHLYCSNSGRHRVERYTPDGDYTGAFGQPGNAPGRFAGCCNPVHLTAAAGGIITSEKGIPRICCYGSGGEFQGLLLDSALLGGGRAACHVKMHDDRLFVAGNGRVSVFRYDERLARLSACGGCGVACPLREGIIS